MQDQVISLILHYKYFIIIPIALVEGPLIMMICGFLLRLGYLSFVPMYIALMIGDFTGDIIWYTVGHFLGMKFVKRFGKYFSITPKNIRIIEKIFHKYQNSILIISKITMGFGFAVVTLFTAGLVRIPFRRYLLLNFLGQFVWTGILVGVGFFFGHVYEQVNDVLGKLTVIAIFIIFFLALLGFGKYLKNRTIQSNS